MIKICASISIQVGSVKKQVKRRCPCPFSMKFAPYLFVLLLSSFSVQAAEAGPLRILFLGHESEQHNSNRYYPMLAKALGPEAIYFDYVTTPEAAFANADHLVRYDAVLLYANHKTIERAHWENLKNFVEQGGGFVPVHCASWCFQNILEFDQLVGGRFKSHQSGVFSPKTLLRDHPAMEGVPDFEAWDETYFHSNHNSENRTVLQVREAMPGDPHTEPEPWTWVRTQGEGRVFYTASGHDERVWSKPEFHALLKSGIHWAVGDSRAESHESFLANRAPLTYEKRSDIPNYEKRSQPLDYQLPLSPEDSLDYTQVPVGWKLELFASEPEIINPISMAWDERGRLWVAETTDYPNEIREEGGNDKIKILEDTDGDGRCDNAIVFAEGLNIPTSLTFANGGVIVAQAPHFLFLKDTDGDDKADVKEVLFSGWGIRDTHAGPSNLRYGFDNWIWGAVGYSSFNGEVGGKEHRFGSGIYRFKPDGSEIEFIAQFNNNTWGLGFNANGDVFGSTANRNPSFFAGIPQSVYGDEKRMSAKMIADSADFHPITPNIRQVDAFGLYTAGAGHALATSANFPVEWQNRSAFVCGPTGNLVGRFQISPDGSGYSAKNEFALVASVDEWFSPVAAEVGPDGNLWIADWYNFIIQHNPAPTVERAGYQAEMGIGNAHVNPNRDKQHGRIYRLVRDGATPSAIASLENATTLDLVAALGNDNLQWRSMAQRLLVESKDPSSVPILKEQVRSTGVAAIHALWALEGLGELDREIHQFALLSSDSGLKRNAIKALGTGPDAFQLFFDSAVVADKDPQVRLVAFAKLAAFPRNDTTVRAAKELMKAKENREDEWLSLALKASGGDFSITSFEFGPNLFSNPSFEELSDNLPASWSEKTFRGNAEHSVFGQGRTGERSLRIHSQEGADASWLTWVDLKPNTEYRLRSWIKTQGVLGAQGALLNVHELGQRAKTNALVRNNNWTQVERIFNSGKGGKVSVNLLFGGWGTSRGTAWYDDVELQEMIPIIKPAEQIEIVGDVTRGRQIFHEHQVAACIRCHVVGDEGGPIGPALDGIASRKSEEYLRQSLVDPQAVMAEGFPAEISPMPPMNVLLKEQEFEDVMAYVLSLK